MGVYVFSMEAKQATTDEAQFECKHCGSEHDELEATECDESPIGFCSLQHKDPQDAKNPETHTMKKTENTDETEETDDWKTMSAEECKKQAGLKQVDGLVWEQADN